MIGARRTILWGFVGVGLVSQLWLSLRAQETNAPRAVKKAVEIPPLPPPGKAPVEFFRELLAMNLAERNQALAERTPEARRQILAKVREYQSLPADVRELRLRATELRWYLLPMMRTPATNRTDQLSMVPSELRPLVNSRLKDWDLLPPDIQKEFLQREAAIQMFLVLAGTNATPQRPGLEDLKKMPTERRQVLLDQYDRYLGLTADEKQKILLTLSPAERTQIEKSLQKFEQLTPPQRATCLRSFDLFKSMSLDEREQFLKNAIKWSRMKPEDRKQWQDLVERAQLLPPSANRGLKPPPVPEPLQRKRAIAATNAGGG